MSQTTKTEEYDRASKLTDEELISQGRRVYRDYDRKGDHFMAGVIQELWIRMNTEKSKRQILEQAEDQNL